MTVYCFIGPSLPGTGIPAALAGAVRLAPVRHGDLLSLDVKPGDTVAIVDGVFYSDASVRHKEILDVLSRGARVVGGSSMGALRAAEMKRFGMIGVGRVFELYDTGALTSDDEVAIVHRDEDAGYRPMSVALVSVREAGGELVRRGSLGQEQVHAVTESLAGLFYMERTVRRVRDAALAAGIDRQGVTELVRMVDGSLPDVKARDARLVLEAALTPPAAATADVPAWWATDNVALWRNTFALEAVRTGPLRERLVLQALQLFDPAFPRLYADVVHERLARGWSVQQSHAALAAEFVRRTGVESVSPRMAEQWLYPLATGDRAEVLLRLAVATYREQPNLPPWDSLMERVQSAGEDLAGVSEVCQVAVRRNAAIAASSPPDRRPELSPAERTLRWVAELWDVPYDIDVLRRVGYLHGFRNVREIHEVARKFVVLRDEPDLLRTLQDPGRVTAPSGNAGPHERSSQKAGERSP